MGSVRVPQLDLRSGSIHRRWLCGECLETEPLRYPHGLLHESTRRQPVYWDQCGYRRPRHRRLDSQAELQRDAPRKNRVLEADHHPLKDPFETPQGVGNDVSIEEWHYLPASESRRSTVMALTPVSNAI